MPELSYYRIDAMADLILHELAKHPQGRIENKSQSMVSTLRFVLNLALERTAHDKLVRAAIEQLEEHHRITATNHVITLTRPIGEDEFTKLIKNDALYRAVVEDQG